MKFSGFVEARILDELSHRSGFRLRDCSICGQATWALLPAFAVLLLTDEPQQITLGPQILPSAILYCTNCGNTHFINLQVLGLGDLLVPEPKERNELLAAYLNSPNNPAETPLPLRESSMPKPKT